jgi:hypothetical protein
MSVCPNQKYLTIGQKSVDTSSSFGNQTSTWNPLSYSVAFSSSFQNISSATVHISLINLHYVYGNSSTVQFYANMSSLSLTSFEIWVYSNFSYQIQTLTYRYLILINPYFIANTNLWLDFIPLNVTNNVSLFTSFSTTSDLGPVMNLTGGISGMITFTGFDINMTSSSNTIDLALSYSLINTTLKIILTSGSSVPIFVNTLYLKAFLYNLQYYNTPNFASFTFNSINGAPNSINANSTAFYDATTIVGMTAVQVSGDQFWDISLNLNNSYGFSVSSSNTNSNYTFNYIYLHTYYCDQRTTPYLYQQNNTCYDICPIRYYGSSSIYYQCQSCAYDCFTCLDSVFC